MSPVNYGPPDDLDAGMAVIGHLVVALGAGFVGFAGGIFTGLALCDWWHP